MIYNIEHRHLLVAVCSQRAQREILQSIPGWMPDLRRGYQGRACFLFVEQEVVLGDKPLGIKHTILTAAGNDGEIRAYYDRVMDRVRAGTVAGPDMVPFTPRQYASVIEQVMHQAAPLRDYTEAEIAFDVITKNSHFLGGKDRREMLARARERFCLIGQDQRECTRFNLIMGLEAHAKLHLIADIFGGEWSNVYGFDAHWPGDPDGRWFLDQAGAEYGWRAQIKEPEAAEVHPERLVA